MSATPLAIQSFHNQNKFSTPNSPFSSDTGKSPAATPYLPNYLLGNTNSPTSPAYGRSSATAGPTSPVYGRTLSTGGYLNNSPSKMNSKSPPNRSSFPYASSIERKQQRVSPTNSSNQEGAPPTESLYSNNIVHSGVNEVETTKKNMLNVTSDLTPSRLSQSVLENSVFSPRPETIPQSPAQIDPFYSEGEAISSSNVLDDTSVTVFGFPPAASSFILQQFSQYGTVEKHEIHNAGNWLHIKYQTKIQAKKALSKNGKIFARSIMIGVCPCIKKEISTMEAEFNSPAAGVSGTPQVDAKKLSTMRALSSTSSLIKSASSTSEAMTDERRTPQKKDSVVGKALDYVFGW